MLALSFVAKQFNASDVLQTHTYTQEPTPSGISFFNVSITAQHAPALSADLVGSGVYGLFQRRSAGTSADLIYIGKYQGHQHNPFAGNVAAQRWWTHIASVTARGKKMSITQRTAQYLIQQQRLGTDLQSFCELAVEKTENPELFKDRGCVAGLNRILFALRHWAQFRPESNHDLLAPFFFHYVRLVPAPPVERAQIPQQAIQALRTLISQTETELIHTFNPPCNHQAPVNHDGITMTPDEFERQCFDSLARLTQGAAPQYAVSY